MSSSTPSPDQGWETISITDQFKDDHLAVTTELVKTPTRSAKKWSIVRRKAAVVIAPMTRDGKFLLVRQERVPLRATIWEMPAGQVDGSREPREDEIRETALRELHEETGYDLGRDGELIALGDYFTSPGFTDEHGYFFLARGIDVSREYNRDHGEGIVDCRAFSVAELREMIAHNQIRDANTLSICARMAARGLISLSK